MTGWCSPTYPKLLQEDATIQINMDQSAMIAGFLMIGNMFGTLPAHFVPFGAKYGIVCGLLMMVISWFVLWQANNIYCILASRFLIGFGNSFGTHHGKEYIKQMSDNDVRNNLVKSVQIYIGIGVLVAFSYGPYVDFQTFSVIALVITSVISVFSLLLPHSPTELVKYNKIAHAKTVLCYLKPGLDVDAEVSKIKFNLEGQSLDIGKEIIQSKSLSYNFTILMFLVFFQQCCGSVTTIIYCILILEKLSYPNPEILAIIYILFFILGNAIGTFQLYKFNLKCCLFISSLFSTAALVLNTLIMYFNYTDLWEYTSYVLLVLFIFSHSIGLGPLPFLLTPKLFPRSSFVSQVQTIFYSIWAIVVTKIFQVLFTRHAVYVPFTMFSIAGVATTIFILIFIPADLSKLTEQKINSKVSNNNTI